MRIFERLREEHGYTGGYTIVKDYVRQAKLGEGEMFVPLSHVPGAPLRRAAAPGIKPWRNTEPPIVGTAIAPRQRSQETWLWTVYIED